MVKTYFQVVSPDVELSGILVRVLEKYHQLVVAQKQQLNSFFTFGAFLDSSRYFAIRQVPDVDLTVKEQQVEVQVVT